MDFPQLVDIEPQIKLLIRQETPPQTREMAEGAERARLTLMDFYEQKLGANVPEWANYALKAVAKQLATGRPAHRAISPATLAGVAVVERGFSELPEPIRQNARHLHQVLIAKTKADFTIEGEVLRARIRDVIDPNKEGAKDFLAELGQPALIEFSGEDSWHLMTTRLPEELLNDKSYYDSLLNVDDIAARQIGLIRLAESTQTVIEACNEQFAAVTRSSGGLEL